MSSQYFSDDGSMNSLDSSDSTAWSIDSFIMESIEVEESKDDFMKTLEKDLQVEVEKESYGDMDEFMKNIDVNQLTKEREDSRLLDIVNAVKSAHCVKSMPLSESQKHRYFSVDFWKEVFSTEKQNITNCLIGKVSQLPAQNKNLAELDVELCISFSAKTGTDDFDRADIYILCDEFIKISRKMRYLPRTKNISNISQKGRIISRKKT